MYCYVRSQLSVLKSCNTKLRVHSDGHPIYEKITLPEESDCGTEKHNILEFATNVAMHLRKAEKQTH